MSASPKTLSRAAQLAVTGGLLVLFPLLIWHAGDAGFASLLSSYAARANRITPANAAVSFAPADPEAHYLRGAVLEANDNLSEAIAEYDEAASLRPDDYVLWLSLARARELDGDKPGAVAAARQAVPLARYYAQPHWQLGNILVRAGQRDEGFKELRLAGASNPTLLPGIIDLAWLLSNGDVSFVKQAIQPQTPEVYRALAEHFKQHGKVEDAIAMLGAAGSDAETLRARELYLSELISGKQFKAAYALWVEEHSANSSNGLGVIVDPGFEQESNLDHPGLGGRAENKSPSLLLSLDTSNPKEGHSCLQVEFNGDSDPSTPIIAQLVLVGERTHYQLHLAARTDKIITGGPPNLSICDVNTNRALGESISFPLSTDGWRDYTLDFTTGDSTTTIQITIQRERCSKALCPIFGRLWLDAFSLQEQ